jgi:hypothetical protein
VDDQRRCIASDIENGLMFAMTALDETSRLMGRSDSPLNTVQIVYFQHRCRSIVRELRHMFEATSQTPQQPT